MSDEDLKGLMAPAINRLTEELDGLLQQVAKKKQAVNVLYESIGEEPPYHDVSTETTRGPAAIRSDQFYGRAFATVAKEYLEIRKHSCTAEEITRGLEQGGYNFPGWKESDRIRLVAVNIAKNTGVFHKVPGAGGTHTFGLAIWYPDAVKRAEASRSRNGKLEAKAAEAEESIEEAGGGEIAEIKDVPKTTED